MMKKRIVTLLLFSSILFNIPVLHAHVPGSFASFNKTIVVKGDQYYPPFEFLNERGEPDGFNVELFRALAREVNLDYRLELGPWDQVVDELKTEKIDALLGIMISAERAQSMQFTVPHSLMTHGVFTHKDSPIRKLEDLRDREVIVQKSDRMHEYLQELGITRRIIVVVSQRQALSMLNEGNHDAALIGTFQGMHLKEKYNLKNIELRDRAIEPQRYAMAVSRENDQLLALLNHGLYQLKANGKYDEIYEKWFSIYEKNYFFTKNKNWLISAGILLLLLMGSITLLRFRVYYTKGNLRESEARYRSIFQNKHTIMMLIDPQTGDILDANPAAEAFYGWPHHQLVSMNINQISTLDPELIQQEIQRASQERDNLDESRHRLANGEIRQVEVHSGIIILKKKKLLFSIIHDVTQKVKALQQIRDFQNLLQFIIMHAPNGIAVLDNSLRYIYVSDRYLKDYGVSQLEILGRTPFEAHAHLPGKWEDIYRRVLAGEVIKEEEDQIIPTDGPAESIRWECHPWYHPDNTPAGIIHYSEVITERKKSEELRYNLEVARKTTQIKQTLLANISHEMRTPLNGIIGLGNHLAKTTLTPEQNNHLSIILDSSQTLLQLINQVLNLSKIESEQLPLPVEEVSTREVVRKLTNAFAFLFQEKGLDYSIEVSEDFPRSFIYNESKIMQVLTNLVGNALKFTHLGGVRVVFERSAAEQALQQLMISVVDTGTGISPEHHENVFLEFVQVQDNSKTHQPGTGLGLPISRKIVESLGGKMGLISQPTKGSTFWFTINPIQARANEPEQEIVAHDKKPLALSVLLVEDKKVNQLVAELTLKEMGCETDIAENGLIAIEKIQQNQYDVILMDIQMPVMDGVTAMKKLKAMNISLPPIIGLSAQAMEGDAERYIAMGMDDYITKPINSELLYQKLQRIQHLVNG
ncbi:MAG: transporter substrate-binding domain-containing protein [Bacteroidales bacterium]